VQEAGLKCNAKKCKFAQVEVTFVGFALGREGHKPVKSRVDAIQRLNAPTNVRKVQEFLGVVNFIKNHIPNRAILLETIK